MGSAEDQAYFTIPPPTTEPRRPLVWRIRSSPYQRTRKTPKVFEAPTLSLRPTYQFLRNYLTPRFHPRHLSHPPVNHPTPRSPRTCPPATSATPNIAPFEANERSNQALPRPTMCESIPTQQPEARKILQNAVEQDAKNPQGAARGITSTRSSGEFPPALPPPTPR